MEIKLSPSILSADFANLARDIKIATDAGAEYVHVDVMDGHFVPNITIGAPVVKALRKATDKVLDVHLMISDPDQYLDDFIKAGSDIITVHYESNGDTLEQLKKIRAAGVKAACVIKPKTPAEVLFPLLPYCDMVLIMTVEPGFGGQGFIPECMDKIKAVRAEIQKNGYKCELEIDGGAKLNNTADIVAAGADVIVAGSAVFGGDIAANVKGFHEVFKEGAAKAAWSSNHISVNNPQSLVCLTVGGFLIEMRDKMNELTKRIVSCVLLMMIGLGCFFGISGWQSSPETHRTSIEYLNEKQTTVMKLTAASTAASAAVSALPGDTGSAIAEKLADLTSDFLIVLCAIMLEKYLLTITGYAVFRFILPAVCVLLIVRQFRSSEILAKLAFKLALFGMAVWLAVSGGITVSRMIEATYETSLSQTIEDAQSAADAIDTSTGSDSDSDSEKSGFWSGITSSVQNTVSGVTEKFEQLLSNVMEALAVLIVTSCVLPVLVLLFLLWIVKMLTGLDFNLPKRKSTE